MTLTLSELTNLEDALALRLREAETASATIEHQSARIRRQTQEVVNEGPPEESVVERIGRLQLYRKLLANIRLNQSLFDDSNLELRVNQLKAVEALAAFLANNDDPRRRGYFKQPTGAGKTVLFGVIARLLGVRTLVLVPRTNLVNQTVQELQDVVGFDASEIGILEDIYAEGEHGVTVTTYQSHQSRMKRDKAYREWVNSCELVVCDEAHRSLGTRTAESIDALDENLQDEEGESEEFDAEVTEEEQVSQDAVLADLTQGKIKALKLGFTATPRLSNKTVEERFNTCIATETHADLADAGVLVRYRLVSVHGEVDDVDFEGTFSQKQEAETLHRNETYSKLANEYATALRAYRERTDETPYPMRGVAFCVNIGECDEFLKEAAAAGLRARIVTGREAKGKHGQAVINAAQEQLISGEIDLIITVAKLGEGWNFPPANAAIWARAAMSEAVVIQGIGRIARNHFDAATGMHKPFGYVFETQWSLRSASGRRRRRPLSIASALARNGDNPEEVCQNADLTSLEYEKPITQVEVMGKIKAMYGPVEWSKLEYEQRKGKDFAGTGLGLLAIASLFGFQIDPVGRLAGLHELGRFFWGEEYGDPEEKERTRVQNLIKAQFSPRTWQRMSMQARRGKSFAGTGLGISSIATLFNTPGSPSSTNADWHALGRALWGEEYGDPAAIELQMVKDAIRASYSPEVWRKMKKDDRGGADFAGTGMGLMAIGSLFGFSNPVGDGAEFHRMGQLFWGEEYGDPDEKRREEIRAIITVKFTAQQWRNFNAKDKKGRSFAGTGMGLWAIATLFGVTQNPVAHLSALHELGRVFWGEEYGDPEMKERERLRQIITSTYSREAFASLQQRQRGGADFAGTGLGIMAIATIFGVTETPRMTPGFQALVRAIWDNVDTQNTVSDPAEPGTVPSVVHHETQKRIESLLEEGEIHDSQA